MFFFVFFFHAGFKKIHSCFFIKSDTNCIQLSSVAGSFAAAYTPTQRSPYVRFIFTQRSFISGEFMILATPAQ